jgi:hypothetical protein
MSTKTEGTTESKAPATTKTKAPKAPKAPKAEKVKKVKAEKVSDGQEHRGRKVNSSSARQQRLARFAEKIARGEEVKRGRPRKDPSEKPVKVKKEKVAKTEKVKKAPVKKAESVPAVAKAKAKRKH